MRKRLRAITASVYVVGGNGFVRRECGRLGDLCGPWSPPVNAAGNGDIYVYVVPWFSPISQQISDGTYDRADDDKTSFAWAW